MVEIVRTKIEPHLPHDDHMTLPLGEALEGKYEILEKIGEGGMGSVYKVRHRLLEEVRVIKVLRARAAEMEDLQRRFLREARMAIRLKHPNIAQLHDFSIAADGTAYIVMEFIDGIGLDAMIKTSAPPSVDLAIELSTQALTALHYLHEHQFVHRDVSPDNLMLTSSFDGSPLIKLIDLGIAKNLDAEVALTQTGVFLGKVRYCSPEQFSGKQGEEQVLDRGSDIYSFGVLLYEMLTGVYPFNGESFAELAGSHLFQPPKPFEETDPEDRIPEDLRNLVLKALEKDREERFETADEFSGQLAAFRNPEIILKEEFDRTVEVTTSALPKLGEYSKPGSTQGRLNREFGLDTTPSPQPLTELREREPVEEDKKAAPAAADSKARTLTPARIASAAVALALVATVIALWSVSSRSDDPTADATGQIVDISSESTPSQYKVTERWNADMPDITDLETDVPLLAELPPFEDETGDESIASEVSEGTQPPDIQAEPARTGPATPAKGEAVLFQPGVGVIAPVLLELPDPVVPAGIRPPREQIMYSVRVLVDEFGKVITAQVESGPSFRRRLREAAAEAAKKATFRPASKDGMAGRMWTEVRIVFGPQ